MKLLKQLFPYSFESKETFTDLVKVILAHLLFVLIAGAFLVLLCLIPLIGLIFNLILYTVGAYITAGILLSILDYANILK